MEDEDIVVENDSEQCANVELTDGDTVMTVTFDNDFGGSEVPTLTAGSVTDVDGNPGPSVDHSKTVPEPDPVP